MSNESRNPVDQESQRIAFAGFLRRLAAGKTASIEWNRFVVAHYHDEKLESIRRDLVRLCIGTEGRVQWSDSEFAALQIWSRELSESTSPRDSQ